MKDWKEAFVIIGCAGYLFSIVAMGLWLFGRDIKLTHAHCPLDENQRGSVNSAIPDNKR